LRTLCVWYPDWEGEDFEPVVEALESLVPRVEIVEPGLALVAIGGALTYYGGEEELAGLVNKEIPPGARLGVADGPFAARWAAHSALGEPHIVIDTPSFLASLDVAVLEHDELKSTLRWLGITTLGDLAGLPREAITSRFGLPGLVAHRLASGEDHPIGARPVPPLLAVESHYDDPLEDLDRIAFAARALAARLMAGLRREGVAPYRVEIEAEAAGGEVRSRVWRSLDPFVERTLIDRVWWQLRAWVEQRGIAGGLVRLRLDPADLSGEGRQLALLDDPYHPEAERALARAQSLLGPDAVLQARGQGGRMPDERVLWYRWGEPAPNPAREPAQPWPGATPGPSPALVPPQPTPLAVEWDEGIPTRVRLGSRWEPVINWAGPWRLVGRWWKGETPADRYQLVTSAGAFLVLVRDGSTFLAGVYD
jgi:protein ImuB